MSDKQRYLVFVDIDGVLASNRVHIGHNSCSVMWNRFDPVGIDFFNKIHDEHNVDFVITSTWKDHLKEQDPTIYHWISAAFANSGFRGRLSNPWKTDPDNTICHRIGILRDRAHEIKDYLELYGKDVADYIIFDDSAFLFNQVLGKKRLIKTDSDNGILYKHMLNAMSIMGTWEKK